MVYRDVMKERDKISWTGVERKCGIKTETGTDKQKVKRVTQR
jgi:hypothetical protein